MVDFIDYHRCLTCGKLELFDEREDPPGPTADCKDRPEHPYPPCQWVCVLVPVPG